MIIGASTNPVCLRPVLLVRLIKIGGGQGNQARRRKSECPMMKINQKILFVRLYWIGDGFIKIFTPCGLENEKDALVRRETHPQHRIQIV